jgi:phosphate-selective porin OprO and OprP
MSSLRAASAGVLLIAVAAPGVIAQPANSITAALASQAVLVVAPADLDRGEEAAGAGEAGKAGSKKGKKEDGSGFVWDGRPSLRFGKAFRMDFRVKLQADVRASSQDLSSVGGTFEMSRHRVGIKGTITERVEYEVEAEIGDSAPWRDVFLDARLVSAAQIRGGKFKVPFSLEEVTSPTELDFVYRARVVDALAPGRDIGGMVHGRLFKKVIHYQVGVFQHDGDNPKAVEPPRLVPGEAAGVRGRAYAGRVIVAPFRTWSGHKALKTLEAGGAMVTTTVPEGENNLQGRSVFDGHFFPRGLYVKGPRVRTGLELNWTPGSASVRAEYIRATDARDGQGVGSEELVDGSLPRLAGQGWYVSGTWVMTGEKTEGGVNPKHPLFRGGFGAVQVGARYETLSFGTPGAVGPPSTSPRSAQAIENRDSVVTFGVNWYVNRWVRVQGNGIREAFLDPARSPVPGRASFWSGVCRLQFVL